MRHHLIAGRHMYALTEDEFRDKLGLEGGPMIWRVMYDVVTRQVIIQMDTDPPTRPVNLMYHEMETRKETK